MPARAKIPVLNSTKLTLGERAGNDVDRSAMWWLHCKCGAKFKASAPYIKKGFIRCPTCQPKPAEYQTTAALKAMPATWSQILERTGMSEGMLKNRMPQLRKDGKCHVGSWTRAESNGAPSPIFHRGPGPDVPYTPVAMTRSEYSRRYRANMDVDAREKYLIRDRTRKLADRMAKRGDPMVNALFGRAA